MSDDKKYKIIRIALLLGFCLLIFCCLNYNPYKIIKNKLNLTLPSRSKIISFNYNILFGDIDAKIQINEHDVTRVKNKLHKNFGEEYKNTSEYFTVVEGLKDFDKNNIIVCYDTFADEEKYLFFLSPKCHSIWIFITKENDGEFYLYISS